MAVVKPTAFSILGGFPLATVPLNPPATLPTTASMGQTRTQQKLGYTIGKASDTTSDRQKGPPSVPVWMDSFIGIDGTNLNAHTLDTGQTWEYATSNNPGYPVLSLNGGTCISSGDFIQSSGVLIVNIPPSGLQKVAIDFVPDMTSFAYFELRARSDNAAAFATDYSALGYNTLLQKFTLTGNGTDFGLAIPDTLTTGTSYRMELKITLTTAEAYLDGTLIGTRSGVTLPPAPGQVGMWFLRSPGNGTYVDNLRIDFG